MSDQEKCGNCRYYFSPVEGQSDTFEGVMKQRIGQCRRFPAEFAPTVIDTRWCGEWSRTDEATRKLERRGLL